MSSEVLAGQLGGGTTFVGPGERFGVEPAEMGAKAAELGKMRRKRRADRHLLDSHDVRFSRVRDGRDLEALLIEFGA